MIRASLFWCALTLLVPRSDGLGAQELPLRTDLASSAAFECPIWMPGPAPSLDMKRTANEQSSKATEALVLGDAERARGLLARALELDGTSAELHYAYARVVEGLGAREEAIEHLCHALALPEPENEPFDARQRVDSLASLDVESPPPEATRAFAVGVDLAEAGRRAAAADAFQFAVLAQPSWPEARYNLGVVLGDLGQHEQGAEQLHHYLTLSPRAPDAAAVARVIGRWEAENAGRSADRRTALTLGLMMPGMGQMYSGRPRNGFVVLAAAGAAVAAGLLVKQVDVVCLDEVGPGQTCSKEQVLSRRETRPYLGLSLGSAGLVTALGALDAYFCWTCRGDPLR
jgi:tetratricopeptide (TPR) repeat protein